MKLVKPRFFIDMPSLAQSVGAISHSETVEGLGVNAYDLHFLNYKKPKTPVISAEETNQIMKMILKILIGINFVLHLQILVVEAIIMN